MNHIPPISPGAVAPGSGQSGAVTLSPPGTTKLHRSVVPVLVNGELGLPVDPHEQQMLDQVDPFLRSYVSRRLQPWKAELASRFQQEDAAGQALQALKNRLETAVGERDQLPPPQNTAVIDNREKVKARGPYVDAAVLKTLGWLAAAGAFTAADAAMTAMAIKDTQVAGSGLTGLLLAWLFGIVASFIVGACFEHGIYREVIEDENQ